MHGTTPFFDPSGTPNTPSPICSAFRTRSQYPATLGFEVLRHRGVLHRLRYAVSKLIPPIGVHSIDTDCSDIDGVDARAVESYLQYPVTVVRDQCRWVDELPAARAAPIGRRKKLLDVSTQSVVGVRGRHVMSPGTVSRPASIAWRSPWPPQPSSPSRSPWLPCSRNRKAREARRRCVRS